jgi:ERCC4-type nuclease
MLFRIMYAIVLKEYPFFRKNKKGHSAVIWLNGLCHKFDFDYRFRLISSPSSSSTVEMIFELA